MCAPMCFRWENLVKIPNFFNYYLASAVLTQIHFSWAIGYTFFQIFKSNSIFTLILLSHTVFSLCLTCLISSVWHSWSLRPQWLTCFFHLDLRFIPTSLTAAFQSHLLNSSSFPTFNDGIFWASIFFSLL